MGHRLIERGGLRAFLDDYPLAVGIMLYGGDREESREDRIRVLPVDGFLRGASRILG